MNYSKYTYKEFRNYLSIFEANPNFTYVAITTKQNQKYFSKYYFDETDKTENELDKIDNYYQVTIYSDNKFDAHDLKDIEHQISIIDDQFELIGKIYNEKVCALYFIDKITENINESLSLSEIREELKYISDVVDNIKIRVQSYINSGSIIEHRFVLSNVKTNEVYFVISILKERGIFTEKDKNEIEHQLSILDDRLNTFKIFYNDDNKTGWIYLVGNENLINESRISLIDLKEDLKYLSDVIDNVTISVKPYMNSGDINMEGKLIMNNVKVNEYFYIISIRKHLPLNDADKKEIEHQLSILDDRLKILNIRISRNNYSICAVDKDSAINESIKRILNYDKWISNFR